MTTLCGTDPHNVTDDPAGSHNTVTMGGDTKVAHYRGTSRRAPWPDVQQWEENVKKSNSTVAIYLEVTRYLVCSH